MSVMGVMAVISVMAVMSVMSVISVIGVMRVIASSPRPNALQFGPNSTLLYNLHYIVIHHSHTAHSNSSQPSAGTR